MRRYSAAIGILFPLFWQAGIGYSQEVVKAQDTKGSADQRADQILKQLTLEEKVSLLSGDQTQFQTHAVDRLGIPGFWMSDGPNGVRNGKSTPNGPACAFPCGAALAATWNPDLAAAYGKAIGLEDRARGTYFQLGPGVNICRVPINGRNFEYFGEDPYLASMVAVNWVKGCSSEHAVPTIKHFAANNQETNRNSVNAVVDERVMQEIYLPAFKKAVTEGGIVAVMCSYNRLNGHYASNNDWLLNQTLKKEWGFAGLVMSDWGASHDVTDLARGLDLEMPTGQNLNLQKLQAALGDGRVSQGDIDGAAHRFLRTAFAQGWLDAGWQQQDTTLPIDSPASAKTALDVASEAMVLLKNDGGALPLDRAKVKRIVVIGPNARAADVVAAGADGEANGAAVGVAVPANIGGGGSGAVEPPPARIAEADYFRGISRIAGDGVKVDYVAMPGEQMSVAQARGGRGRGGGGFGGRGGGGAPEDPAIYETLANAHTADGKPGLTLTVEVTGQGDAVSLPPAVQTGVNAAWQPGQLPFGVPAGRDATYTWKGTLQSAEGGDFELRVAGNPTVTLDGKPAAAGTLVHLEKNKPVAIEIVAKESANVAAPAGRGGRGFGGRGFGGGGGAQIRVALVTPVLPDLSALKGADAVIVCIGLNRNVESEGRDRPFELPALQQLLVKKAAEINPHTVVITNGGGAVGMENWKDNAAAIVHAYYLGEEGGLAVGKMLFGDVNPSGRLCSTFDRAWEENPAYPYYPGQTAAGEIFPTEPYTEGLFYGYRGYDKAGKEPAFPFGFGLSYTTFEVSGMKVEKAGEGMKVSVDVKNTGSRAGAEVVQVYVGEQGCPEARPARELKGFAKVMLAPGESRHAEIALPREAFGYWSSTKKGWTVDTGNRFTIEAGVSERDIKGKETVQVQ